MVFDRSEDVLVDYERIALLSADFSWRVSSGPEQNRSNLILALREKAADLGSDAIILEEITGQRHWEGWTIKEAYANATAIRFGEAGSMQRMEVARSPENKRVIVVAPLTVIGYIPVPDSVSAGFTRDICDELRIAGFEAVSAAVYDSVWAESVLEVRDPFDPVTGVRHADRAGFVHRRTFRTLIEEYGADGILYPEIQMVDVAFKGTKAEWDGVSQKIVFAERSTGEKFVDIVLHNTLTENRSQATGALGAVSLAVQIENTVGAIIYTKRGGIELLEGLGKLQLTIFQSGDPGRGTRQTVVFPPEQIFKNPERNREAVRVVLEPLRRGG